MNTTNNSNNCGTCGNVCGVGQVCVSSTCVSTTAVSYSLTVTKNGAGSGTITSNPAGIGCGADCTENYSSGTLVTLTATPAAGSTFTGWSGEGCAGTGSCNVAMNASRTVIAFFNTINTGKCTESDGGKNYLLKGTCQDNIISSLINTDFCNGLNDIQEYWCDQDHNWCAAIAGSCSSLVGPGYICKEGACTLAADSFALSVSKSGTSSGTVTSNPAGINCGNICSAYYSSGTLVTLTATPAAGSTFTGWSGVCSGNNPTCVVNVNQAYTPTATFNTTASLESTYKCPDINNDGIVDIFDAIITSNSINKCSGTSGYDARADVDGNNCVTSIDQNFVQKYLDQKAVDIAQCKSVTTTQTKSLSYFEGMLASISNAISEIIQNLMKLRGY
jgi:hypothetical protein